MEVHTMTEPHIVEILNVRVQDVERQQRSRRQVYAASIGGTTSGSRHIFGAFPLRKAASASTQTAMPFPSLGKNHDTLLLP